MLMVSFKGKLVKRAMTSVTRQGAITEYSAHREHKLRALAVPQ